MAGQPTKLHAVAVRNGPELTTVAERILQSVRLGNRVTTAASAAGVPVGTVQHWLLEAARVAASPLPLSAHTPHEQELCRFGADMQQAEADWHQNLIYTLEAACRKGLVKRKTKITYDLDGAETGREVTEETLLPDTALIMARLKSRYPDLYSDRVRVTGEDGGPVDVSVRLVDMAAQLALGLPKPEPV